MEAPNTDLNFVRHLQAIRKGLKVAWQKDLQRFMICHKHEITNDVRVIRIIETAEGQFRHPDMSDIIYCRDIVMWELLDKYPNPNELYLYWKTEKQKKQDENKKKRKDFIHDMIKEDRKNWLEAVRLYKEGNLGRPTDKKANKIQVDFSNYKQQNGILMPKFSKGE